MRLHMMKAVATALLAVAICLLFMINDRPWMGTNRCNMTYMYRILSYMHIDIDLSSLASNEIKDLNYPFSSDFSRYSTILYGEGEYAIKFIYGKTTQLDGIPVIFVPGNAGSSRQVRSLGTVLQNKTESRNLPFRFDVFAVDFNGELSGLSGMYLERQMKYLELVVKQIWNMYSPPPRGIIFVGHSMGGVVIRSLLGYNDFDLSRIAFVVTLGTPHKYPPIVFDWYMKDFYDRMHKNWKEREKELANLLILSISGGLKDHLVPEHLTLDHGIRHVSTTAVDGIELETDHLCIVWCNQLVRRISRLMIEYAKLPGLFHRYSDNIVKQLFETDGVMRQSARTAEESTRVVLRNGSVFMENNNNKVREIKLSFPKDSWLFIARSSGTSLWGQSEEPIYAMTSLGRTFYTLIHANITTELSVQLGLQQYFKAVVLLEDSAEVVNIGLFSFMKGFFTSLWQAEFEGSGPVVLLPIYFSAPVVAITISLELISCNNTNGLLLTVIILIDWFGKVEFRSQDLRRMNTLGLDKKLQFIGHLLHKKETKADIFFLLDQRCRFHARLDLSYLDTLIMMFRMYGSIIPYMLSIYILCALSISNLADEFSLDIQDFEILCYSLLCHMCIVYWNNLVDWLTVLVSSVLISCFTYLLQLLACAFIWLIGTRDSERSASFCYSIVIGVIIMVISSIINYFYNGFLALFIIIAFNLFEHMKTVKCSNKVRYTSFWHPVLLIILHLYVVLIYAPFGICSFQNVIKHGFYSVYEDPARAPAYFLLLLKFMRFGLGNLHSFDVLNATVIILAHTCKIESSQCVAQLGIIFIMLIGMNWLVDI